jgi:hypothetical protein
MELIKDFTKNTGQRKLIDPTRTLKTDHAGAVMDALRLWVFL